MTVGVIVMAYGSPSGPDDIERYYTDIRRGRPPSPQHLAELTHRYDVIGGVSPLLERTKAQIAAITIALEEIAPGAYETYYGAKHASPTIEQAVGRAIADGVSSVIGVVLAPHYASASVGEYIERARAAVGSAPISVRFVEHYGSDPTLVDLLAERVGEEIEHFADVREETEVIFTAHALPLHSIQPGDRYVEQVAETAALVGKRLGLDRVSAGWQSAGMTPDPWLGPDVLEMLDELWRSRCRAVVVCPCGFTSDHLEVLYDLDVIAQRHAIELWMGFARTRSLNDDPRFASMLARRIVAA
jgi:ferrochelatase